MNKHERKQAEEALKASEMRFKELLRNVTTVAVQGYALDGTVRYWNRASEALYGYTAEEALGQNLLDLIIPPVYREDVREAMRRMVETGETIPTSELVLMRKDGSLVPVYSSHTQVRLPRQKPELFCIDIDLTNLKQAEEALIQKQRYINLSSLIANVFLTSSMDEVFADVLDVLLKAMDSRFGFFGYIDEAGDLVCPSMTRDVWDQCQVTEKSIVFPRSAWAGLWGRSLMEKQTLIANENLRVPEGHVALENALATPIVHHDKLIGQFVVANKPGGYDTEDKDLLQSAAAQTVPILFAIQEKARQKIAHEKLEEQLRQAQKMESVGRLAGGVAHDFNNMLSVILGHTELALGDLAADNPLRYGLEEIRKAAERSANLTRQLLAFARKQIVEPKVVDLNETITSLLKMLERLIGEDIDLLWKPGTRLSQVRIDPGQVDQMLANLVVNARDAIGDANGKVTIEAANARFDEDYCAVHAGFMPGDYVMLAVSDNGCGMDEETRSQIFEPFFTTKPVGQGTGLGLATIYGIVKQNHGFINVYSEPGKGTAFRIYLPALDAEPQKEDDASKVAALPMGGKETILFVEDEPAILNMTRSMLEPFGYTVLTAATPSEATRLVQERSCKIDLVITDVVMPEMNGRDMMRGLKECCPNIRSLFMSGYTANVIAHHGVLEEGVNFIQKPFSSRDLVRKIRETLDLTF